MNNHSSKINFTKKNKVIITLKKFNKKEIFFIKRISNNIILVFERFTKPESIVINSILTIVSNAIASIIKKVSGYGNTTSILTVNLKAKKKLETTSNIVVTNSANLIKVAKINIETLNKITTYICIKTIKKILFNIAELKISVITNIKNYRYTKLISLDTNELSTIDSMNLRDIEKKLVS